MGPALRLTSVVRPHVQGHGRRRHLVATLVSKLVLSPPGGPAPFIVLKLLLVVGEADGVQVAVEPKVFVREADRKGVGWGKRVLGHVVTGGGASDRTTTR